MRARLWLYGIALVVVVGLIGLMIPAGIAVHHCGGNGAALSQCRTYISTVLVHASDYTDPRQPFLITNLSPEERKDFAYVARPNHWIPEAHYLVSTQPIIGAELPIQKDPKSRRILIVCDTPFDNVPEYIYWHAPLTHAVGYSDGTTGLISRSEFAALDRSSFKRLDEIFPESAH